MVEPIMYIGIGFLVAGLLVIGVIPLVHARAVRLTMRRMEALTPMSMAEIQADKDQLRAEFAMTMSRVEMTVEQMKAKTTSQLAEIGRKSEAIGRLKFELGEKTAALLAVEARERQLADDLRALEGALATKSSAHEGSEQTLASTQAELAQLSAQLHHSAMGSEGQRVELAALRAQTEVMHNDIQSYEQEIADLRDRLGRKTAEAAALDQHLGEQRGGVEQIGNRVGELERELVARSAESEAYRAAAETLAAEKGLIEGELRRSQEERDRLQRELAGLKRDVQNAIADEGKENAVLRERINDVAAEVARLTATLEGPESPIGAILEAGPAAAPAGGANGASPPAAPRSGTAQGTLADRISALQGRAARVARPTAEGEPARTAARGAPQRR
jgi:predicted nuclease with TOPRIM domain